MAKDAGFCCGREIDKRTSNHFFDAEKYIVKYENAQHYWANSMRVPTRWERIKSKFACAWCFAKTPFVKLFYLVKYAFENFSKVISIKINIGQGYDPMFEVADLRKENENLKFQIAELNSENEVLRRHSNEAFYKSFGGLEDEPKKKAAKKRPSSKKKSKG